MPVERSDGQALSGRCPATSFTDLSQDESLNLQIHEEAGLTAQPRDFVTKVRNPALLSRMEQLTQ